MEIKIPYEIGDPILVIDYNQYDEYYINCRPFCWNDIPNVDKTIFKTRKEAEKAIKELEVLEKRR